MDEDTLATSPYATMIPSSPPLDPRYRDPSPTSSEPPLFSSDGPLEAEDVTNYESPRVKRKRFGPWWDQEVSPAIGAKKTKLSRNFDSGVFMMSDGSFGSDISDGLPVSSAPPTRKESRAERIERETEGMTTKEAILYHRVHELVENDYQDFLFSDMGLEDSDLRVLHPITTLIQPPRGAGVEVPAYSQYRSMIPELYMDLSKNRLSKLEPTLFNLQYLTALNLWSNQIEELPPQIAKLENLKSLNLCMNKLSWLPCEILGMFEPEGRLNNLVIMGNPAEALTGRDQSEVLRANLSLGLYRIDWHGSDECIEQLLANAYGYLATCTDVKSVVWLIKSWENLDDYKPASHHRFCPSKPVMLWRGQSSRRHTFLGATPPSYFDTKGHLLDNSPDTSSSEVIINTKQGAWGMPSTFYTPPSKTKITSLTNLTIETALLSETPANIRKMLGGYLSPTMERLLQRAEANFEYLSDCHVCDRKYLVPAAEWIEAWHVQGRQYIRLKVKVCSWGCVPDVIGKPPQMILKVT
jgi:hypothetical protein